ncbi:MAG: 6-carboxytetrahydropterin synthase [Candidatus Cloacimonas acidaminovorans]|nr:6-carboxytetrahydropterin synthase [Candidatus Cloacimonas acidaminovorans]
MFYLKAKTVIYASHILNLDKLTQNTNQHWHNWEIIVYCKSYQLNKNGLVVDPDKITNIIKDLDHSNINLKIENPTVENIAKYIAEQIPECYKVKIIETPNKSITYCKEDIAF